MKKKETLNLNDIICERNRELSDADIQGMAASIGNTSLLNPIILYFYKKGKLKVAAGRCRYFALQLLERYELPPEDYKIIDTEDAALISFIENFERRQLSLLEEAEQISGLLLHHDVAEIATILGRSEKYIRFRANINKLTDYWKKALSADQYPHFKAGHYEAISRFPESVQKQMKNDSLLYFPGAVKDFVVKLDKKYSRLLVRAQFDNSDCFACEKNTNKQPWLFEELKDDKDCTCLDQECWNKKTKAYIKKEVQDIKNGKIKKILKNDITLIANGYYFKKETPYKAIDKCKFEMIEVLTFEGIGKANAFIVCGDDAGCYCLVRLNDEQSITPPQPKTVDDKRQQLQKRRVKKAILNLHDYISRLKDVIKKPKNDELLKLATQLLVNNSPVAALDKYRDLKVIDQRDMLWDSVLQNIIGQLHVASDCNLEYIDDKAGKVACDILRYNWDGFIANATKEIKTPKSLED